MYKADSLNTVRPKHGYSDISPGKIDLKPKRIQSFITYFYYHIFFIHLFCLKNLIFSLLSKE